MDPISKQEDSSTMSDEDDCSGDDDEQKAKGIGRRFCIERKQDQEEHQHRPKQQMASTGSRPKRARIDSDRDHRNRVEGNRRARTRVDYERSSGRSSRRRACSDQRRQVITIQISKNNDQPKAANQVEHPSEPHSHPNPQQLQQRSNPQPEGPVIFINPNFIKKFIEKSIELTSSTSNSNHQQHHNSPLAFPRNHVHSLHTANKMTANKMIEEIDFKTSPKEALQAASTMAIIRLVTECIEDDSKRDEKLNKTLAARLIDSLIHHNARP